MMNLELFFMLFVKAIISVCMGSSVLLVRVQDWNVAYKSGFVVLTSFDVTFQWDLDM